MKTIKDKNYNFNHTKERLKERFNLPLTQDEYESLCNDVCGSTLIAKESVDQEIHKIFFKGLHIKFTFSRKNGRITTVIPKERRK